MCHAARPVISEDVLFAKLPGADLKLKTSRPSTKGAWGDGRGAAWAGPQWLGTILEAVPQHLSRHKSRLSHLQCPQQGLEQDQAQFCSLPLGPNIWRRAAGTRAAPSAILGTQRCLPVSRSRTSTADLLWSTLHPGSKARKVLLVRAGLRLHSCHVCRHLSILTSLPPSQHQEHASAQSARRLSANASRPHPSSACLRLPAQAAAQCLSSGRLETL